MTDKSRYIGLSDLLELVEAAIFAARTDPRSRVSLLLVAPPENCKTQLLFYYSEVPTIRFFSSLTAKPLLALRNDIESGRITHIALQDLCSAMSHQKTTSQRLMMWLAMLMDEGAATFADAGGTVDFRGRPKLGVLSAITPELYQDARFRWWRTGLISRFVSVFFRYQEPTTDLIHAAIRSGLALPDPAAQALPDQVVQVTIPEALSLEIELRARHVATWYKTYGFRFHRSFRLLAQGHALARGKTEVGDEQIAALDEWLRFMNPDSPGEI